MLPSIPYREGSLAARKSSLGAGGRAYDSLSIGFGDGTQSNHVIDHSKTPVVKLVKTLAQTGKTSDAFYRNIETWRGGG